MNLKSHWVLNGKPTLKDTVCPKCGKPMRTVFLSLDRKTAHDPCQECRHKPASDMEYWDI